MKKILSYTLLFIVLVFGSCKKMVDENPLSDGTLDQFFKSKYDVFAAVAGMYGAFQQTMVGETQFNNRITWWGDARSDNIQNSTPNSSSNEVHFNNLSPNNTYADWSPLYTVIGRANLIIAKINEVNTYAKAAERLLESEIKYYTAQAYAMRAVSYFYILRIWGDAPIRTAPFLDLDDNPFAPRDSKTKVRDQIITDLQKAYDLTAKGATPIVWYLGEGAIAAIMADVYMWNAFERGRILSLEGGRPFITGKWLIEEGGKIGNFYGWRNLGVYASDAHNAYTDDWQKLTPVGLNIVHGSTPRGSVVTVTGYELNGKPYTGTVYKKTGNGLPLLGGDVEWEEVDVDGVIDDNDRQILGNAQPDFYFGIINTFNYNQFSLNVIFNGTIGGKVYNSFKQGLTNNSSSNGPALPEAIYGAWVRQGQEGAMYPYFPDKDTRGSQRGSGNSYFLEDASFLRLTSVKLSYRFKPAIAKKAFLSNAGLFIYGINLLTWTNYTGYDPEFSSSNALQIGDDNGKYPKRRELGMGVNIQF